MGPQLNLTNGANSIDHNSAHTIIPFWVDDDRVNNDDGDHGKTEKLERVWSCRTIISIANRAPGATFSQNQQVPKVSKKQSKTKNRLPLRCVLLHRVPPKTVI